MADFRPHVGPLPRTRLQMPTPGHREARFQNAVTPGHRDTGTPNLRKVHRDTGRQYFKTLLHRDTGTPDLRKVHRHTGRPHTYETRVPVAMSGVPDVRVEVCGSPPGMSRETPKGKRKSQGRSRYCEIAQPSAEQGRGHISSLVFAEGGRAPPSPKTTQKRNG